MENKADKDKINLSVQNQKKMSKLYTGKLKP